MKTIKAVMELLGIEPFSQQRMIAAFRVSPKIVSGPIAVSLKKSSDQLTLYRLITTASPNGRLSTNTVFSEELLCKLVPLLTNPKLNIKAINEMVSHGLWRYFSALREPPFDPNKYVKIDPKIRGELELGLARSFFRNDYHLTEETLLECWKIGIKENDGPLLSNCIKSPNASANMLDAYLIGCTIQEIELRSQGMEEEIIDSIKDFFWY